MQAEFLLSRQEKLKIKISLYWKINSIFSILVILARKVKRKQEFYEVLGLVLFFGGVVVVVF